MRVIEIEEMKKIQFNILLNVANFCEENNIRYFLCGGTLLGAIRHKGFIPWDDDIDIAMPREDYETFLKIYENKNHSLFFWKKENKCLCTFAKVYDTRTELKENGNYGEDLGVCIDVFPVDGLPSKNNRINFTVKKMKALWGLVVCATVQDISKRSFSKKVQITIMRSFYKAFPIKHYVTGLTIKSAQKYPFDYSNKVAVLVWGYGKKEVISHQTASDYIKVEFENHNFNVPRNYEEYLTNLYGDYMQVPPKEQQVYKHGALAYWKE